MITMDTVCGSSFLEAAVVQAEAAAGVEVAEHPEAAMAPHPGDLKTEWLSLVSLLLTWVDEKGTETALNCPRMTSLTNASFYARS